MKMSKNTLLKKIEQGYRENYCNGEYTLNLVTENKDESTYVLKYTYETGEEIAITITASYLGQVSFYSNIHHYYISNFNIHTKSVINVMRILFDLIDCNKDDMLEYYRTVETKETDETENNDIKGHIYIDTDSVKVAPLPEQQIGEESIKDTIIADDTIAYQNARVKETKPTVLNVMQCMMCQADREGNRCGGEQWCKQTWKRYGAIVNPEWHHVNLETVRNIDNDMLDEKRRIYCTIYRELKRTINDLSKCKTTISYRSRMLNFRCLATRLKYEKKLTLAMCKYLDLKLSMANVENGLWSSDVEVATGQHYSRKYNRPTLR